MEQNMITVVSGLPRSGTSMMMKALVAGGMQALTDNLRTADEDNPKGYFELERVKALPKDNSWMGEATGKAVKIISALLKYLPQDHSYKIIFMRRKMDEILASQRQMLIRRGEPTDTVSDARMAEMFGKHLNDVEAWIERQPNIDCLYVSYNEVLASPPTQIDRIHTFLGGDLNTAQMVEAVDKTLYRQQR